MKPAIATALALLIAACAQPMSAPAPTASLAPPVARTEQVVDVYHGVRVADPYRWLEAAGAPDVRAWTAAETAYARRWLDALPERPAIDTQVRRLAETPSGDTFSSLARGGDWLFALKLSPGRRHAALAAMPAAGGPREARTVFDPDLFDPSGRTVIDWYVPSHDGRLVALSLSVAGSEAGDLRLVDVATGAMRPDFIPRVEGGTAGGALAWAADNKSFYYTRYPRTGERAPEDMDFFVQIYRHTLGEAPADDAYVFGREAPRIAEYRLLMDRPSGRLLISVQDGDSSRFAHWLRAPDGRLTQISGYDGKLVELVFGPQGRLYGVSWARDLMGEIVVLPTGAPTLADARRLVPPDRNAALNHSFYTLYSPTLAVTDTRLFAIYQTGGPRQLRVFTLDGAPATGLQQTPVSSVSDLTDLGRGEIAFSLTSYVSRPRWLTFDPASGAATPSALNSAPPHEETDIEVRRIFATSKDGAKIPVNILIPAGARLDGTAAIVVTGYGGFGLGRSPQPDRLRRLLFDNGVIWAEANLRGGDEFGEAWHRAGMLADKQRVFDDFAAVIETLTAQRYAAKDRVAIIGGSNGGLLVGALLTQHPDLVAAVVARSGIFDGLRNELDANGVFNAAELGSVSNVEQFRAIRGWSPYHNVRARAVYPAVLLFTSANDPRVNPMHSRKFAARLQAAQAGASPILLLEQSEGGHGVAGSADQIRAQIIDQHAFLMHVLKVKPRAN